MRHHSSLFVLVLFGGFLSLSSSGCNSTSTAVTATLVSIVVSAPDSSVAVDSSTQLTATGTYSDDSTSDITSSVSWESSDVSVGTVSTAGIFTAVAAGSTDVTATKGTVTSSAYAMTVASDSSSSLPGNYIITFKACDEGDDSIDCMDQPNHYTYLGYSDDGASWTPLPDFTPFKASVPDPVIRGGTLYIYTPDPDQVTRYDIATGTVESEVITITESDGSSDDLGDVSAYLDPSTNEIVLFYKSTAGFAGDPQLCDTCAERSATEVDGSDGAAFTMDSGDRIAAGGTFQGVGDADIFYDGSNYIIYVGKNSSTQGVTSKTYVYTSSTLRGTYALSSSLSGGLLTESGSVPAGFYDTATGKYWTYITVLSPTEPAVIKRAVHSNLSTVLTDSDFTTVLSGATYTGLDAGYTVEGAGIVLNE